MLSFMSTNKIWLLSKTVVFYNNIERVAPFNSLYEATLWLHLINYLEPLVAPNSLLNGAALSTGWLQIAYPIFKTQNNKSQVPPKNQIQSINYF